MRSDWGGVRVTQLEPLVSVIIPVYETEDFLGRCVNSVRGQSYSHLEILLVDDGSPDRCPGMCDAFALEDSRITVIHQKNAGQGVARNNALDVCTGDYIMFVDSDDYIEHDMVRGMVDAAREHDVDLVQCGWKEVSGVAGFRRGSDKPVIQLDRIELMRAYLLGRTINVAPWAKLFRRHLFELTRFPMLRAREDEYIMHEVIGSASSGIQIPDAYYVYIRREGSTEFSREFNRDKMTSVDSADRLTEYVQVNFPSLADFARIRRARVLMALMREIHMTRSTHTHEEELTQLRRRLRDEIHSLPDSVTPLRRLRLRSAVRNGPVFRLECLLFRLMRVR